MPKNMTLEDSNYKSQTLQIFFFIKRLSYEKLLCDGFICLILVSQL